DHLAATGIHLTDFSVCPVSSPTRSSLMTGRESLRAGVSDTYNGMTTLGADEITIANVLKDGGYNTAIFGKWHLGDNYPCRPIDKGFDEALVHCGGGMGQPGDFFNFPKGDSCYFDPILWHNGKPVQTEGYCTDVFANAAINYINNNNNSEPFFIYLAFNAPHDPLQLPQEYYDMYKDVKFESDSTIINMAKMSEYNCDSARRVYGMVTNIDDNIGKIMTALKQKEIADNTLIIFMTDNGPLTYRYNAQFRDFKSSVNQGGVRVPCIFNFPSKLGKGTVGYPSAHLDMLPTIASICDVEIPKELNLDGENILPKIEERINSGHRTFYHHWIRRCPVLYNNIAIRDGDYKLIGNTPYNSNTPNFELYNIIEDPSELNNIISEEEDLAQNLKHKLDCWYKDIVHEDYHQGTDIVIGSDYENPVYLNRNDTKGQEGIWLQENIFGYWDVDVAKSGQYDITCYFIKPLETTGKLQIKVGGILASVVNNDIGISELSINDVYLAKGKGMLTPWYKSFTGGKYTNLLPLYIKITAR
ncbi:MAG: sulfatase-like hydrolase/transferase, partial [Rikenellaceae bacterium]